MRYTLTANIEQGDKLAKNIYASDGRILLNAGIPLTVGLIARLNHMGVQAVFLEDEQLVDVTVEEVVSEKTRRETTSALSETFQYVQGGGELNVKSLNKTIHTLLEEILTNKDILLNLTDIRTEDNALYTHSINVCMMAVLTGYKMGLERLKLQELAIGALLHDIGKILPPRAGEESNHHTWRGFNFLRKNKEISTLSSHIALAHHEQIDGSGEPRGLEEKDIHLLARITAVANYYDNLVSGDHEGNQPMQPFEACEKLLGLTNHHFSYNVVWKFMRTIAFYPTGSQVKLTSGEGGVVVQQHKGLPQRPIVRTFKTFAGQDDDFEITDLDLAEHTTLFIKDSLD
ncbi:HD domain-containing protein [Salibacterium salarium]|uniref:HD domain-containing protein n=1 Tax=Salibacterium salarium TaxID=284579 RepID=A0A3R9P3T3_9BACI|nr:HD domain-containing phosphohydrolase [Salibacterium salarium]RSL30446.1 HD domain-containing protein [Salibacterium salarium]